MKQIRVVLADDHAVLRTGLRLLIEGQQDMAVAAEAADGPEAVRQARRVRPDLVVLDLTMPLTDPFATIRQLSQLGVRTVVLTMHDDDAYVAAALEAGALAYVVKKAADVELLSAIRAVGSDRRVLTGPEAGARRSETLAPPGCRRLSAREAEVLRLIAYGFTNREVAGRLHLSIKTVETFRARVYEKLGLRSRADLVRHALRMGLVVGDKRGPGIGP